MNEVEPLELLNRDGFVLALNPLGSINERWSENKPFTVQFRLTKLNRRGSVK
jgi:hypothetical protein